MMTDKLISVIVPVYNTEDYVKECLDSLLRQTYRRLEIIIVNDGSRGNIREIASEYMKQDDRVQYVEHSENRGLFSARCTGMQHAKGDYFAFADSDDWMCEDFYRVLIEKAEEEKADVVTADYLEMHRDGIYAPHNMLSQGNISLSGDEIIDTLIRVRGLDYGWWVVWNKLYARRLWDDSCPFLSEISEHIVMCEDVIFSTSFLSRAERLRTTHHNYYYYRKNNNASTVRTELSAIKKNLHDIELAFSYAEKTLGGKGLPEKHAADLQIWKNNIVKDWRSRIEDNRELTGTERAKIEKTIARMIVNDDLNPINQDRGFCSSSFFQSHDGDKLAEIKRRIIDPAVRIVSFDVFDTLLVRPFIEPVDLFELMNCRINPLVHTIDWFDFKGMRVEAEKKARERKKTENPGWEDITLDEIYDELVSLCPALAEYRDQIIEMEFGMELQYNQRRETAFELYRLAKYCGKRVICTSDMYLSSDQIRKILSEKGYTEIDQVYVSCEIGKAKANQGNLFREVLALEKAGSGSEILHIGDNPVSDAANAEAAGIGGVCFPRTIHMMMGSDEEPNRNEFLLNYCLTNDGYRDTQLAFTMPGIRCMLAVAANRIYDNPFVFVKPGSDLNNDAYTIGQFCLGPAMFGTVDWLIKNVEEGQYEHLHFMARDGYLPMKIYEELNRVYQLNVQTHYTYLTRKAITPLMVRGLSDYYNLANNMIYTNMSPGSVLKLLSPLVKDEMTAQQEKICLRNGFDLNRNFRDLDEYYRFGNLFFTSFFDGKKYDEYRENMGQYLNPGFTGKTATFDVGYSGRIESTLARTFGYDITAHYIHTNTSMPYYREQLSGIKINTLFPIKPFVTGVIREIMISELGPSCIGYRKSGDVFGPQMGSFSANIQTEFVVSMLQRSALDFVKSMVDTFGDDIRWLKYRYFDACMILEHYLLRARKADMELWGGFEFEDDMGMGDHISVCDWWSEMIEMHNCVPARRVNVFKSEDYLNSLAPHRRMLVLLGTDLGEVKKRAKDSLFRIKPVYYIASGIYVSMRTLYRGAKKAKRFVLRK